MNSDQVVDIVRATLYTALEISAPMLIIAMVVGFGISVFQSVTQISEMTLTFVPKMLIFAISLVVLAPWMLKTMLKYTYNILLYHWDQAVSLTSYTS